VAQVHIEHVHIEKVDSKAQLEQFIDLPYRLHRGKSYFVPPLRMGEVDMFNPHKNPFFAHARINLFLAWRDSELVGRVAAIDDDHHNDAHGDNILFFGFFDAVDEHVAEALLQTVEAHARSLERSAVRGPTNPTMNDGSGFQVDAFDSKPFVMMPANPARYPQYVEALGYHKVKDLYAWFFDVQKHQLSDRLNRIAERARKRYNLTVRPVNLRHFDTELAHLKHIYSEAWEENWGFVKYTDAEFDHLAADMKLILDPEMALFVESQGEVVAVCICLPNLNDILQKIPNGRLIPRGIPLLLGMKLLPRRFVNSLRLPILGVMPKYRNRGIEALMIAEILRIGKPRGYVRGELSWVLEDNHSMNHAITAAGAEHYKTYRLYQKDL
jgi:GNAT superfamily N-acetyltransferase